jgi:hypothetical protein
MTIGEVIQALRDADLTDDAETNIGRIAVTRGAFIKIEAYGLDENRGDIFGLKEEDDES